MSKKIKFPDGGIPDFKLEPIDSSILENINARMSESLAATSAIKELEKQEFKEFTYSITQNVIQLIEKQNEMIDKQSETINQLSALVGNQQKMIDDGKKESRETRFFTIISLVIAVIAIVVN